MLGYIIAGCVAIVFLAIIIGVSMMVHDYYVHEHRAEECLEEDNYQKTIDTNFEDNYNTTQEFDKDE